MVTEEVVRITRHIDELIMELAKNKENVYVFYPIPELPRDVTKLIGLAYKSDRNLANIRGTNLAWYEHRNKYIINHFNSVDFPSNVHLLNPRDVFCDEQECFAVKGDIPLYFDNNHPSILGAARLVELIK